MTWSQAVKHKLGIPDATVTVAGTTYPLEVDNSTEGVRMDRLAGKRIDSRT